LQFYPSSDDQIQLITSIAQKAGFGGGVVVDYPNSKKAKKVFLCLFVGGGGVQQMPQGLQGEEEDDSKVRFERRREREKSKAKHGKRKNVKDRDWILKKKEASTRVLSPITQTRLSLSCFSCIENGAKRAYPMIPNLLAAEERPLSEHYLHFLLVLMDIRC
jgi:hypothetical protein